MLSIMVTTPAPLVVAAVDARRAFWLWYLDKAIPTVLEAQ